MISFKKFLDKTLKPKTQKKYKDSVPTDTKSVFNLFFSQWKKVAGNSYKMSAPQYGETYDNEKYLYCSIVYTGKDYAKSISDSYGDKDSEEYKFVNDFRRKNDRFRTTIYENSNNKNYDLIFIIMLD